MQHSRGLARCRQLNTDGLEHVDPSNPHGWTWNRLQLFRHETVCPPHAEDPDEDDWACRPCRAFRLRSEEMAAAADWYDKQSCPQTAAGLRTLVENVRGRERATEEVEPGPAG